MVFANPTDDKKSMVLMLYGKWGALAACKILLQGVETIWLSGEGFPNKQKKT